MVLLDFVLGTGVEILIESAFRVDILCSNIVYLDLFSPLLKEDVQFDSSDRSKPPTIVICVQLFSICVC